MKKNKIEYKKNTLNRGKEARGKKYIIPTVAYYKKPLTYYIGKKGYKITAKKEARSNYANVIIKGYGKIMNSTYSIPYLRRLGINI